MILVHPLIDPVIISFNFVEIRWYSLAYILGFLIGIYLIKRIIKNHNSSVTLKNIDDFFIWSVLGVIIGGRIGYIIFYQIGMIFNEPIKIFFIWEGGMSFHGGLFGIILSIFFYSRYKNITFFLLSDLVSFVAPIGILFGRLANFINVELYGRITNFPFAMIYPNIDNKPRHPSQLYEAFFEGFILLLIAFFLYKNFFIYKKYGIITSIFLIFYGIFRFFLEFLREPDFHIGLFFNFFTIGQFLSVPMIILGMIIYFKKIK